MSGRKQNANGKAMNSIRLSGKDLVELLDRLDQSGQGSSTDRTFKRWSFRHPSLRVDIIHPGGSVTSVRVVTRNISAGGMGVLHAAYVHPGSACEVHFPIKDGKTLPIPATVNRCLHVDGKIHELGLKFHKELPVSKLAAGGAKAGAFHLENVDPDSLEGVLIVASAHEMNRRIVKHFLSKTRLRIIECETVENLGERLSEGCDVLVLDEDLLGESIGSDVLREGNRPSTILTGHESAASHECVAGYWDAYLPMPMEQAELLRAVAEFVSFTGGQKKKAESSDGGAKSKVLGELAMLGSVLSGAVTSSDPMECYYLALRIKTMAQNAGLGDLVRAANSAAKLLSADPDEETMKVAIEQMTSAIKRHGTASAA